MGVNSPFSALRTAMSLYGSVPDDFCVEGFFSLPDFNGLASLKDMVAGDYVAVFG